MRATTMRELADRYATTPPDPSPGGGFDQFLSVYDAVCDLIRSGDDLRRLVTEVAEDARSEGCVWIEPHVFPPLLSRRLGDPVGILELMVDAAADAARATGVGIGLLVSADRGRGPEDALYWARQAARWAGRGVTSFGLAADEARHPPGPFARAFAAAREAGLLCVPHAGELAGPEAVREALTALRPHRLAHGVRAVDDASTLAMVADAGVTCDVCPTSNVVLGVVPSIPAHPLRRLLEAGVAVSLNADDPLLVEASIADEYATARDRMGLDDEDLAGMARASVDASGAPETTKRRARDGIAEWLTAR